MSGTPGTASYSSTFGQSAFDQFIAQGQAITLDTLRNLDGSGRISPYMPSIGLSASVCDLGPLKIAHVNEVLGTKYHDAEMLRQAGGPNLYGVVGHDTAMMILNDIAAVGALPFDLKLFFANQGKKWFDDRERTTSFYAGWAQACDEACLWFSGGETAGLHCTIVEGHAIFAGSAVGVIWPNEHVYDGTQIQPGDRLIGWASRGLMCNGFTLVHTDLIPALPGGYLTELGDGRTVGEALLEPTDSIVPMVRSFRAANIEGIRMINNITGHGWAKIMRGPGTFDYVIDDLPKVPRVFDLLENTLGMSRENGYRDYNRGLAGVVICSERDHRRVIQAMNGRGLRVVELGYVDEPKTEQKRVLINPGNIVLVDD